MKKIVVFILISLLLSLFIFMAAFSKDSKPDHIIKNSNSNESDLEMTTEKAVENSMTSEQAIIKEPVNSTEIGRAPGKLENNNTTETVRVIAKSENTLTDSEKQVIVEELSNEIESLIEEVNNIEEFE